MVDYTDIDIRLFTLTILIIRIRTTQDIHTNPIMAICITAIPITAIPIVGTLVLTITMAIMIILTPTLM